MKTTHSGIQPKIKIIKFSNTFMKISATVILIALNFLLGAQTTYKDYFNYLKANSPIDEGTQITSIVSTKNGYVSIGVAKGLYSSQCTGLSLNFKKEDGTFLRHNRLFNCDSLMILGGASGSMLNDSILFLNFLASRVSALMSPKQDLYLVRYNVKTGTLVSTNVIENQIEGGGYGVTMNSTKTMKMNNGSISVMCGSFNGINVLNFNSSLQLQLSRKVIILPTINNTTFEFNVSTSSFVEVANGNIFLSLTYEQVMQGIPISTGNLMVELDASLNTLYTKVYDFPGPSYLGCTNLVYKNQNLLGSIGIEGAPYMERAAGMYKIDPLTGNILSAKTIQALNIPFMQGDTNNYSPSLGVQSIQGNNFTFFCVVKNYSIKDQFLLWNVDNNLNLLSSKKSNFSKIDDIYGAWSSGCLSNSGNEFIINQYVSGYGVDTINEAGIASELFVRFNGNLKSNCSKTYPTLDTLHNITNYFTVNTVFTVQVNPQPLSITSSSLVLMDNIPLIYWAQRALCASAAPPNLTGIAKHSSAASISISPNPASASVLIENKLKGVTSLKMQVINAMGQLISEENFIGLDRGNEAINYSVTHLQDGIYYLKLETNKNEVYTHKLVIAH